MAAGVPGAEAWVRRRLPQMARAAREARLGLRSDLRAAGVGAHVVADAELVMGELVANAVQHGEADADGMIGAAWCLLADRLLIRVTDSGHAGALRAGSLSTQQERGRGLALVERLSHRWRASDVDGTRVEAELLLA